MAGVASLLIGKRTWTKRRGNSQSCRDHITRHCSCPEFIIQSRVKPQIVMPAHCFEKDAIWAEGSPSGSPTAVLSSGCWSNSALCRSPPHLSTPVVLNLLNAVILSNLSRCDDPPIYFCHYFITVTLLLTHNVNICVSQWS